MKRFIKGDIETVVDDNDPRIPSYLTNGWKEAELKPREQDKGDEQIEKAINDVVESEGAKTKKQSKKPTKKVNDAIEANTTAATESEVVDDGLIKQGDK